MKIRFSMNLMFCRKFSCWITLNVNNFYITTHVHWFWIVWTKCWNWDNLSFCKIQGIFDTILEHFIYLFVTLYHVCMLIDICERTTNSSENLALGQIFSKKVLFSRSVPALLNNCIGPYVPHTKFFFFRFFCPQDMIGLFRSNLGIVSIA